MLLKFALWILHRYYNTDGLLDYCLGWGKHYPRMMIYTEDLETREQLKEFIDTIGVDNPNIHKYIK